MNCKNVVLLSALLLLVALSGYSFDPVVVGGTDVEFATSISPDGQSSTLDIHPRLALSWRQRLADGGYVSLVANTALWVPLDRGRGISDRERFEVETGLPVGNDELVTLVGVESSFVSDGVVQSTVTPSWSADYRFLQESGWIAILTDGFYRWTNGETNDVFAQRAGLGYSRAESIRFGLESDLLAGYELWPEYDVVDASGSETNVARRDLTVQFDGTAKGLWGYFTTWSVSGLVMSRFSNATRYITDVDVFEPDSESRMSGRVAVSLRSSPVRQLGLRGILTGKNTWYLARDARDESGASLGSNLNVLDVSATFEADYTPVERLYFVSSLGGNAIFTQEASRPDWYLEARLGMEYSF